MRSDFTTCLGTSGSGRPTTTMPRDSIGFCAVVRGASTPGASAPRTVTPARRCSRSSTSGSGAWGNSVKSLVCFELNGGFQRGLAPFGEMFFGGGGQMTEMAVVFQKAYDWNLWILPKLEKFPKSYRFP